jgi:tRNA/tmRNA/rRNA uracil-C5-methylase (TrmA/RlmC/RlmD family)
MLEVDVGPVAHGGHCVARAPDGRVVFVRHALPGERVVARVTEERPGYLRADAVSVLVPAAARVTPPCPYAAPVLRSEPRLAAAGRRMGVACGGCDFQHVAPAAQRELKAAVVVEQLTRLGRVPPSELPPVLVEELPGGPLGWRTRVRYSVDDAGRAGLLAHRSHEVVPVDRCLIAHPSLPVRAGTVVASSGGDVAVFGDGESPGMVTEIAVGRRWRLPADVFWQVHPAAPDALAAAVLSFLAPSSGERAWDLYGGAGLFSAALAPSVASVTLVESDRGAVEAARDNLADLANVHIVRSTVERFRSRESPHVVVLDPPRRGAGASVVRRLVSAAPRAVAYVACDPAAFARDVATFRAAGWRLADLRAFDAFPMTHHVECVGLLLPGRPPQVLHKPASRR